MHGSDSGRQAAWASRGNGHSPKFTSLAPGWPWMSEGKADRLTGMSSLTSPFAPPRTTLSARPRKTTSLSGRAGPRSVPARWTRWPRPWRTHRTVPSWTPALAPVRPAPHRGNRAGTADRLATGRSPVPRRNGGCPRPKRRGEGRCRSRCRSARASPSASERLCGRVAPLGEEEGVLAGAAAGVEDRAGDLVGPVEETCCRVARRPNL